MLLQSFQKGKEILELNNFYKRFITSIFGVTLITLSFVYMPEINFLFFGNDYDFHPLILLLAIIFILEILFQLKQNIYSRNKLLFFYFFIYMIFFLHVILLENMFENWKNIFFYLLSQIFITDIFGYLGGKIFGKNKINFIHEISPNKTIEGYLVSIIAGSIWGILILFIFNDFLQINFMIKLLLILSVILTSILGDLFVSKVKRVIGVKDFSNFLYGHGGISDRLDSVLPSFAISFWIFFLL
ncbi:MAG: hypothetical protein CL772_03180 [Chloroflexi bacterium]|nr:hypothetical protein [Chloroflexota bacterium]|tara:strand:- start:5653 stop:6381 length:729 start_codon:yes stop_codon:yes gene_type:complete